MDLSVSIIDDHHELDRILEITLECTNLDENTSLSTYRWSIGHGDSSHEHICALDTGRDRHHVEKVEQNCVRELTLARVFFVFLPLVRMLGSPKKPFFHLSTSISTANNSATIHFVLA